MARTTRSAPRRTAAAIAEDLRQARLTGGLHQSTAQDLAATIDLVELSGLSAGDDPLVRARDLLASHVARQCQKYEQENPDDLTARAAAVSLRTLMLRPPTDHTKVEAVRRAARGPGHAEIKNDTIRKREDKIIDEIARQALAQLEAARADEPRSVEDAIRRLVPLAADLRQQLHDLLCVLYDNLPAADPREKRAINQTTRQVIAKLGQVLLASAHVAQLARRSTDVTREEEVIVRNARHLIGVLFDQSAEDREFMLTFMGADHSDDCEEQLAHLLATEQGQAIYERTLDWLGSCYPTCKFERSTDILGMCSPHLLLTCLYDTEMAYLQLGFSDLNIPGNLPMLHHRLA